MFACCAKKFSDRALFAEQNTLDKEMVHASRNFKAKCKHYEAGMSVIHFCSYGTEFPKG